MDWFVIKYSCYMLNDYLKSPKHDKIATKMLKMAFCQLYKFPVGADSKNSLYYIMHLLNKLYSN